MKNVLKRSLSILLAVTIIFSSAYVGLSELDFSELFAVRAKAADVSALTFTLEGESYSVTDCSTSAEGELVIPDTYNGLPVTRIGGYAFSGCRNLTSIIIPNSIVGINEDCAFLDCTSLTSIIIPDSVTYISRHAFERCSNLSEINVSINNSTFASIDGVLFNKDKTSLIIYPSGKTSSIYTIPDSVTDIYTDTLKSNSNLVEINASVNNSTFTSVDGVLFNKDKTELLIYPVGRTTTSYQIPDSVTSIGYKAFENCINLTSVEVSNNVTEIGHYAFYNCINLTSFIIPNNTTFLGEYVFYNCKKLTTISIPKSVDWIYDCTFRYCDNLETVYYSGTEEEWKSISIGLNNKALFSANIIFNSSEGSDSGEPEQPVENPIPESSGYFYVAAKNEQQQYSYEYKDSYFDNSATEYNHKLATMSLCLALSTFQSEEQKITSDNAKQLLVGCGFGQFKEYNYELKTTADDVGCLISQKQIGDTTLIAVAIRSGGYGKEWASNVTLGLLGDHQGFDEASDIVVAQIKKYIKDADVSDNIKIWLTGYSRGGATATQTAAKLNFETINGVNFTKKQIYAYGFATPAGAIENSDPTNAEKYGNIFNIINFHDLVPKVAPEDWNFGRYGKTYYLPFSDSSTKSIAKEEKVKKWFIENNISDYKLDDFVAYYWESSDGKAFVNSNDSLGVFSTKLINDIASSIGSRQEYVLTLQSTLRDIWAVQLNLTDNLFLLKVLDILSKELVHKPQYLSTAIATNTKLIEAHSAFGAYYLGWMETIPTGLTEKEYIAKGYFTTGTLRELIYNCPVDVYVYDTKGNLVAAIENDMPVEIEGSIFSYGVDENGQKYFYLPVDAEYNITVKAREDCETTCTVNELSGGSFTESRVVTFTEIPMEKGEELSVSTGAYSEEDITEGTENGSSADYTIQREEEQLIKPDVDVAGEEIENYTCNVTVEYDKNKGIVYGGGTFTIGQFCQVTAENKPGYRFSKWTINGETVSTDLTYRFAVKEDVTIVAEYVPCEHPKYIDEVVAPTCTEEGYTKRTCKVCTYNYNDTKVKATGHTLSDWITDEKATVNAAGSKYKKCTVCDEIVETATIKQLKCSKPSIKSASNDGKNVKVTWKKVSGADTYYVYRKVKGGSYSYLGKTTKTYYVDKTAKAGKTYTYKLRAKNEAGYSSYSSTKTVKHLDQPSLKTTENTTSGVKVSWGKVSGASGYKVYRKTSDGWKYLGKTSKTYFTDKTAKSGKKYTYTVKAYSGDYNSSYSSTGVSRYYLADPTLKTPKSTKKGVKLEWSKVKGADGYVIYYKTGSGSYKKLTTVKGSSKVAYTHTKAKKGKTYTYKVKAYKSKTYSAYSNTKKIKDKY